MKHRTHFTNPLLPTLCHRTPSYFELIDALTIDETIETAKQCGLGSVRESIYRNLDDEIFRRGAGHLDDEVPLDLLALYEEFAVSLKEKMRELEVSNL